MQRELWISALALGFVAACGSSDKNTPPTVPSGEYAPIPGSAPPPGSVPTPPPPASSSAPTPPPPANNGPNATPIAIPMAAALQPVIAEMTKADAPRMKGDGDPFAGQFQEGQTLEHTFNILPGKCYTVVAAGAGVTTIDIALQAVNPIPNLPPLTLAQGTSDGNGKATLGGKGNCFSNPTPLSGVGKIVLKATKGSGIVAAQLFVK